MLLVISSLVMIVRVTLLNQTVGVTLLVQFSFVNSAVTLNAQVHCLLLLWHVVLSKE